MTPRATGTARARLAALVGCLAGALALGGCGAATDARGAPAPTGPGSPLEGTLVVLAAASLTDVVTDLATALEQEHPRLTVETGFGASPALAAQVLGGAPADVLVTASPATIARVTDALGGTAVVVAANRLQLAVPAGNPGDVTSLADLADPALTVALCAPEVPCGAVAATVLARAGVTPAPDTLEPDARAVLTRLRLDEADAGLVYRTDVLAADGLVEGLDLPAHVQATTDYPALVLPDAPHPAAAAAFVALLTGPDGRALLADSGFDLP
ncbi:molybdenum ABC transporter, periplasmic molybdate-binding protein [Cellulomonas flavigena DSM 20109]|uniref:Molybdenum ABC transporter, periplasmic molybdate-binding protein n=1 Tax=Cellulomonas flavigena (strain ATCC 482 / DSM 20109 / BCRC 11376 / JCM 18109 / NBRC 3775 / NCIMB 8073 / NRS 134) TaxID=446466 RepID=D5UEI8_CELFN|nr:molybdate ABC transporter substrate-binding protein [Cellulomonas flavigena]ADG74648.1 molybdenum ABC transporter, periplasmic molybdate-binding protein [Cellulomonas flavigena DSM 20109]